MKENYIVINGKKAELTDEQLKTLGIVVEKEITPEEQYALHEELNRKLWKFAMDNGGCLSKEEWEDYTINKYYIWYGVSDAGAFLLNVYCSAPAAGVGAQFFRSRGIAQKAIDEIIKPFFKEHPEYVW
jgi:hypothetical protein